MTERETAHAPSETTHAPPVTRPRIVHFVYAFTTGGMEKVIATLAAELDGFEHAVVCLTTSGPSARFLPADTEVVELEQPPGNSIRLYFKLARTFRRLRPDILCTYNWSGMDGVIAARLGLVRRVVHHEHGWGMEDPEGVDPKRQRIRRFLSRWTKRQICVSKKLEAWLRDVVRVRAPVTQIYNGIDETVFRPRASGSGVSTVRGERGIGAHDFVAAIIARLDPIKNHDVLFRAFARLRETHPRAHLLVVGDGPDAERLARLRTDGIHLLGDRDDVPDLLRTIDVFVLPSKNEGISMTILEAMASARPVLAARVGGNPELVIDGESGTLVPVDDVEALASALAAYADNPARRAAEGAAGRARLTAHFTIPAMAERYDAVYRAVLAGRDPALASRDRGPVDAVNGARRAGASPPGRGAASPAPPDDSSAD